MAKKWIPIIAVIVAVIAIVVIAVIGSNPKSRNKTVYVTNINVTTPHTDIYNIESIGEVKRFMLNDDNTTLVDGKSTFDIDYEVVPTNATHKEVTFTSSDTDVATVDEDGVVTFLSNNAVFITLTSQDEREISTTVQLVWEPATSSEFSITLGDNDEVTYQNIGSTQLFSVEDDTLYLYKGVSYEIGGDANVEITDNEAASLESGILMTFEIGSFDMNLIFDGKEPITQNVEVVEYINTFARGTSYTSYQSTKDNIGQTNYLNKDVENYQVGVDSPYHFDIVIQNDELETVSLADANLEYTVYDITDGETLIEDNTQVFTVNADGSLSFVKTNVGKTYRVVVEPKYNFLNRNALTFEFELTNGVNAFTHYDLKEYFADLDVNNIVIHSNISVIVESNQLDPDGRLVNFANVSDNNGVTGDIYTRRYTSSDIGNGNLDINLIGNYFTIDATNMPYLSVTDGYTFGILEWTDSSGYPCASIQTAIFKVQDASGDAYDTGIEKEEDEIVNFNVKNLRLTGNTSTGIIYETDEETGEPIIADDEAQVIANQGSSSAGFMGRGAVVVSTDNVVITNTNIGIYVTGSFGGIDTNNTYIFDSWANGVFGWRTTSMSLENTTIRQAGGAAICVTDATITDQYAPEWMDVTFNFGPNVVVDNYVSGAEGYFIVNNLSTVVPTLKGQLDSSLQSLLGKTVLKDVVTDEGTESTFNFVIQFGKEKNNYAYKDKNIGNIGSEDGWETYIGGMWLVREGNYLLNKNNPSEKWEITGTTATINKTTDSQFIMNIYNDSTEEYERIERRSGYYTSLPTGASVNGAYVTGISEITNADDAYLMAGVAAGYMQDENFVADITGTGTATGQVATLLNGEVTLIESLTPFMPLLDQFSSMLPELANINTDLTATKQVIYNKIAALGGDNIQAGLQAFSTALSDDMQKIVYLCDATLLNNIKTNIETFSTVLELLNQFGDAIPTFTSGQVTSEQIEQLKAGITGVVNGYAQVLAGAKLQPSLALIPTALTLSNNQLGFTDGTENVNLIEAKINNDMLGDFSGIYICAGIYDVAA